MSLQQSMKNYLISILVIIYSSIGVCEVASLESWTKVEKQVAHAIIALKVIDSRYQTTLNTSFGVVFSDKGHIATPVSLFNKLSNEDLKDLLKNKRVRLEVYNQTGSLDPSSIRLVKYDPKDKLILFQLGPKNNNLKYMSIGQNTLYTGQTLKIISPLLQEAYVTVSNKVKQSYNLLSKSQKIGIGAILVDQNLNLYGISIQDTFVGNSKAWIFSNEIYKNLRKWKKSKSYKKSLKSNMSLKAIEIKKAP